MIKLPRILTALILSVAFIFAPATRPAAAATDFSLRSLNGDTVSSGSLRGKVVVLAFGASWLPISRPHAQAVQKIADKYGARGVEVLWVSTDSDSNKSKTYASDDQLREFARRNGLKVTVLRDPDGAASKSMGVSEVPAVAIFDREGNMSGAPVLGYDPEGNLADTLAPRLNKLL